MDTPSSMRRTPGTSTTAPLTEKPLVAIFDDDKEIIHTVDFIMQDEGYRTIMAPLLSDLARDPNDPAVTLRTLIGVEKPHVFIVDVSQRHDIHVLNYIKTHLLQEAIIGDAHIILTSVDEKRLTEAQGSLQYDILEKPFNLNDLVEKVQKGILRVNEARFALQMTEATTEISQPLASPRRRSRRKPQITSRETTTELEGPPMKES